MCTTFSAVAFAVVGMVILCVIQILTKVALALWSLRR